MVNESIIHGSPMSRMLREAAAGVPLCLTVTLHDGIVLARSAFHHSMNYRSVVVLGTAQRSHGHGGEGGRDACVGGTSDAR